MLNVALSSSLTCLKPKIYQLKSPKYPAGINRSPVEKLARLQFRPVGDSQLVVDPEFRLTRDGQSKFKLSRLVNLQGTLESDGENRRESGRQGIRELDVGVGQDVASNFFCEVDVAVRVVVVELALPTGLS